MINFDFSHDGHFGQERGDGMGMGECPTPAGHAARLTLCIGGPCHRLPRAELGATQTTTDPVRDRRRKVSTPDVHAHAHMPTQPCQFMVLTRSTRGGREPPTPFIKEQPAPRGLGLPLGGPSEFVREAADPPPLLLRARPAPPAPAHHARAPGLWSTLPGPPAPPASPGSSRQGPSRRVGLPTQSSRWSICPHPHAVEATAGPARCHEGSGAPSSLSRGGGGSDGGGRPLRCTAILILP